MFNLQYYRLVLLNIYKLFITVIAILIYKVGNDYLCSPIIIGVILEPHTIHVNSVVFGRAAWLGKHMIVK